MAQQILLADDSTVAQRMGRDILTAEGFEVFTVSNGQAALKKLHEIVPDLILADIFMPGASGYELCQFVKTDPQLAHVPVVLLVGAMEPYDPDEGRKARADAVITKPLQSSNLLSVIKRLLASARPPQSTAAPIATPERPKTAEETAPVFEELAPATAFLETLAEPVLEVPPELAEEPLAAFSELLEPPVESEPVSEEAVVAVSEELSPDSPATEAAPPASDLEQAFPFAFPLESLAEEAPQPLFPVPLPAEEPEPAELSSVVDAMFPHQNAASAEPAVLLPEPAAIVPEQLATLPEETAIAPEELAAEAVPAPAEPEQSEPDVAMSALGFLSGSSDALEQTAADEGVLSVLSEAGQAEAPPVDLPQQILVEEVVAPTEPPPQIAWIVEPVEVTEADQKLFQESAHDWQALTQLAEEPEEAAPTAPPLTETVEEAAVEGSAGPQFEPQLLPVSDAATPPDAAVTAEPDALLIDAAKIEGLVREALEQMMPQIVDRIVRTVGIVLRREQE